MNRSYWPDAEATGQLLTELCEELATETVICGQPNSNPESVSFERRGVEIRNGVSICRVGHTQFNKSSTIGRCINLISFLLLASIAAFRVPRPELVITQTDPFLLPLTGKLLKRFRGSKLLVYLQDIYPDIAIAVGKIHEGWLTRLLRHALHSCYRVSDRVVVLSRDMRDLLVEQGLPGEKVSQLTNWVDTNQIYPIKDGNEFRARENLNDKFVVMHSGNMGMSQRLEDVLAAAELLKDRDDIIFLMVGGGARMDELKSIASNKHLHNVRFLPYQPKHELATSLSAADLHLVSSDDDAIRCLMPSKIYGILASGTPMVAIVRSDSELADIVKQEGLGECVIPRDPQAICRAVMAMDSDRAELEFMGVRARKLAERRFDRLTCTAQFAAVVTEILEAGVSASESLEPTVQRDHVSHPNSVGVTIKS